MKTRWIMVLIVVVAIASSASVAPSMFVVGLVFALMVYLAFLLGRDPDP